MITREEVIDLASTAGFDIQEADEWIAEAQVVDSGNLWITERIERLVHAAYRRGVEDATTVACKHTSIPLFINSEIRKLLENSNGTD